MFSLFIYPSIYQSIYKKERKKKRKYLQNLYKLETF